MSAVVRAHHARTAGSSGSAVFRPADLDRGAEARGQVHADAVRAEDAGQGGGLGDVLWREARGVGVDVREHRAVDAERRVGARVVGVAGRRVVRQRVPVPQRAARVAALHGAIQVVPVIEDPVAEARELDDRERANRLVGLEQAQESERPVEHAEVGVAGDDDRTAWPRVAPPVAARSVRPAYRDRADDVAFGPRLCQVLARDRGGDDRRGGGRAGYDDAVACHAGDARNVAVEEAPEPARQFVARGARRGRVAGDQQAGHGAAGTAPAAPRWSPPGSAATARSRLPRPLARPGAAHRSGGARDRGGGPPSRPAFYGMA